MLENNEIKVSSDKIVTTNNNNFVGKIYCDHGFFVLNISEINKNDSHGGSTGTYCKEESRKDTEIAGRRNYT